MKFTPGRIYILIASICLMGVFFMPIWHITLVAPQYPDGITMYIWINKITGDSPSVIQNINILNHYIGMKYIHPDSIPELHYFPYIISAMAGIGFFFFLINNRYLFLLWGIILIGLGIAGIYDFYLWEYDYGHNLNPKAPIKVPGMIYQPPLFGAKMLLNFLAKSYPSGGIIFFLGSLGLAFLAFFKGEKQ